MPDTFSVSLCLIGVFLMIKFFENNKWYTIFFASLLILMGGLSKIPALLVVIPLGLVLFDKNIINKIKVLFLASMILIMIPIIWWYFYWVPYLVTQFEYWHYYMGTTLSRGWIELGQNINGCAEKFYFDALKYSGFSFFVLGLFYLFKGKSRENRLLRWIFIVESLIFFLFMLKAGRNFWVHSYYIIPFVPIMALIVSYGLSKISSSKWRLTIMTLIIIEGIANQQHDFRINSTEQCRLQYESWADSFSNKSDLFIIDGGDNPKDLYFTHRKGWSITPNDTKDNHLIDSLSRRGARYLWMSKSDDSTITKQREVAFENEQIKVFLLKQG